MDKELRNYLNIIIRLSETTKRIETPHDQISYYDFFKGVDDEYYSKMGEQLIPLIEHDISFKDLQTIDYSWVCKVDHPLANFSPCYRKRKRDAVEKAPKNIVDLFCGAGGLSLGFIQNGFEVSFANDIDDSCVKTYRHNHPSIPSQHILRGNIEEVIENIEEYTRFSKVDVVVGGPPCQGFSMANRQRIIDDPRNKLYKYFVQAVNILKPKVFVMENVKGMLKVAEQVAEDFNNIGYHTNFKVLNAKDFGVPQNRERLIFIGTLNRESSDRIFNNIEKISQFSKTFVLNDALYGLPKLSASRKKNATNVYDESGGLVLKQKPYEYNEYLKNINQGKKIYATLNGKARYNNDRDIEIYRRLKPGEDSTSDSIKDIMPYKSRNHIFKDKYYKLNGTKISKTITAHMKYDCNMYIHPYEARGITPREAARVQSYPDDYFFLGPYTKTYMQIGNSVPPILGRAISQGIIDYWEE